MSVEPQSPEEPFRLYSRHLKEKYGRSAWRVAVDAGFSCPNRGPDRASAAAPSPATGCSYCDGQGSRAPYLGTEKDLQGQVRGALAFLRRRYGAGEFLLYFQAFSGTYAPPQRLREVYDLCLALAPFRELIVSTRPDCLDEERADLLASYRERGLEVWVELGLQSAHDGTLRRIGRGHSAEDFVRADRLLAERGIRRAVHLIFGLPGEGTGEILETVRFVSALDPEGVKIHNLHIPRGTRLAAEYLAGEITCPSPGRHLEWVVRALERLPPRTLVMRLTCDTPADRRIAPRESWEKGRFYEAVRRRMLSLGTWQGRLRGAGANG